MATKLNAWMQAPNKEAAHQQFFTSLERTGAGYFDFYLLHALQKGNLEKYDEYDAWNFVKEQRDAGLIKHWGFSFHDSPELLDQLLTEHPDVDFIQLQINYADWEDPKQASRANWEVARKHQVPVVVMEPVKGGLLANPVPQVADILREGRSRRVLRVVGHPLRRVARRHHHGSFRHVDARAGGGQRLLHARLQAADGQVSAPL